MTNEQVSKTPQIQYFGYDDKGAQIGSEDFNTVVPFDELEFVKWAENEGHIYGFATTTKETYVLLDIDHDGDRDEDQFDTRVLSEWIDDLPSEKIIEYLLTTVAGDKFRQTFETVCKGAYAVQTAEHFGPLYIHTHQIIAA